MSAQLTLPVIECVEILQTGEIFWLYKYKTSLYENILHFLPLMQTATRHLFHFKK